jgi:hypothetical protein
MPYATGFHQAASIDAVRIAQVALQRDVQTQALATAGVKRDTQHARRIPEAERTAKQRERFSRDRGAPEGEGDGRAPSMPGSLLDFLA